MEDAEFQKNVEAAEAEYVRSLESRLSALQGLTREWKLAKAFNRTKFCYRIGSCLRPDGHPGDCYPSMVMI